jgi:hypothetical protein
MADPSHEDGEQAALLGGQTVNRVPALQHPAHGVQPEGPDLDDPLILHGVFHHHRPHPVKQAPGGERRDQDPIVLTAPQRGGLALHDQQDRRLHPPSQTLIEFHSIGGARSVQEDEIRRGPRP